MEKIAILIDSASDIDLDLAKKLNVYFLPLYVNLDSEYFKDREEISPDQFYDWIRKHNSLPKTSTASPADAIKKYEEIKADGYNKVIAISLSSKFSSTYNLMNMAKIDGLESYVFDSANLSMAEGFFAIYAQKLIDEGYSFNEIINKLEEKKNDSKVFFTIDSFKYIVEGGRVPRSFGKIGDALSIKPIITVNPIEGVFKLYKMARGEKKLLKELRHLAEKEIDNVKDYYIFLCHGGYEEGMDKLENKLSDIIANAKDYLKIQISPTLGANTGPGLYGFGLFKLD
ncbi:MULTISPECIES: DegV family protein [Anaerococcus]|jgi:DegV family protein|uniref:DegV family protein n=3 Tax=Anaerococcus TaxID=165779 RepID=A0A3E2TH55_9FIRM|nr:MULTISPECIES: DegV family protein [Anaerococcus]MBP2069814.1 DegV family protein with EDD domain [Anaerococcus nagyae]MDU1829195.1 DegV family protein [Anaerococcus sp.]MDU1863714.1 DegV family protein [Anaerococcus sp.]MDU2565752.1 DegV family protein [Anaerococcus sp.]MDU3211375.1 DegV family protein [Anaerococcus sp.]